MLAYVFWHWPGEGQDRVLYVQRLLEFHEALRSDPPKGFVDSLAHRIEYAPWDTESRALFEDWYLLEGFAALGELNEAAVDRSRRAHHDKIAGMSLDGRGGLYRLIHGVFENAPRSSLWFAKPPDRPYADFIESWRFWLEGSGATLWQRQMVLGPAPEFCALFLQAFPRAGPSGVRPQTLQQLVDS